MSDVETVVGRLRRVGRETPSTVLYTFVDESGADAEHMTWGETLAQAERVAAGLAHAGLEAGDRAVLVYAPSLDFVRAFLGCLLARVVPVPLASPNPYNLDQDLPPLANVARSARAKAWLTDGVFAGLREYVANHPGALPELPWIDTSALGDVPPAPARPLPSPDDVAFVQYTSGSTSSPKGVLITYGNLLHQHVVNARELDMGPDARMAMWVPHYHDFGLVSGLLSALHGNGSLWMMSPLTFVQRPHLWLELASRVRATHTASPNFGYDLVVRKSTPEQRSGWDLSALRVAMSAAEPVRPETVRAFVDAMAPSGFDPRAFCPAYGLAEHTVGVSVRGRASARVDRAALERDRRVSPAAGDAPAVDCVGCGRPSDGVTVRVVDPETSEALGDDRVGELWVDSPSKAAGYDALPEETRATFEAELPGDARRYLRTGDLGFVHEGEVFVVGRLKDTIIVRGRNLHPQDVEDSVRASHPLVRPGGVVAFGLPGPASAGDELAVVVEVRDATPGQCEAIAAAVRASVVRDHRQACRVVIVARPGAVLKTSSGKLRRRACRDAFERGEMATLFVDRAAEPATLADVVEAMDPGFRKIAGDLGRWFARASRERGGRMFHKRATTLGGYAEAAPDPALPPLALLAGGRRYPVLVRHANGVQDDDAAWDNRGATVRLLDPAREGELDAPLLDLLLTTGRCFLASTAQSFLRWMSGSPAQRETIAHADSYVATAAWEMFRAPDSYADVYYHSKTASLLSARDGSRHYARFRLRRPDLQADGAYVHGETLLPPDHIPRREGDERSTTFLHDELRARVAQGVVDYVVEVQLHPLDDVALDCTRPWAEAEHPWRVALRLRLDRVVDEAAVEPLRFNSLHAPAELAPPLARSAAELASLETLREVVYEISACARLERALPAPLAALMTDAPAAAPPKAPAKKSLRVCVLGAGASGLSAAWHLQQQGHQVTVLEAAPDIAGKCASIEVDGRAYDLGGHLCTPQYRAVARLVEAMGLAREDATATFNYDVVGRRVIPWDDTPALREAFLKYRALRERELAGLDRPGLGTVAARAAQPALEWLAAEGLAPLGDAVGASFTSTGYGYLQGGEIPAIYFLKAAETAGLLAKDGQPDLPQYWTVRGGMQALWNAVVSRLPDVRRGVKVRAVERRDGKVRVSLGKEKLEFDRLVVAAPVDDALRFLDATLEERELFGQVQYLDYHTTVARAQGLPERGFYILRQNTDDPARVGHCVAMHHRHPGSDVVLFYSYGNDQIGRREVEAKLREDVAAMGGTLGEVLLHKQWKYFPHAEPDALAEGFQARLEALQGQNSTCYVGSLFNFELIECNVAYAEALVARHFGDGASAAAAVRVATRPARGADEVRAWLSEAVGKVARAGGRAVDLDAPLEQLGLDSLAITTLVTQLSDWLGWPVTTSLLYEQRTLGRVAQAIARVDGERSAPRPEAPPPKPTPAAPAAKAETGVHRHGGRDMDGPRAYWRKHFAVSRWPFEDVIFGFIGRFVDHVAFEDRAAFERVRDRGCLYLANHQVASEPAMLSTIMGGLSGKHLVGLAKIEGLAGDMGWFMEHMFHYPGVVHPRTYVFIDRSKPEELGERINELATALSTSARNVLIHVQGTRSTSARESVLGVNPMFIEMAIATGAPIVPVRFTGGLPAEPVAEKIDVPIGYAKQTYWIGRPILPEELSELGFVERSERVLAGMNGVGPAHEVDEPGPPDLAFAAEVDAWVARTGVAPLWAIIYRVLESLPDPSPDTRRILDGGRTGRLVLGDSPVDRWLAAFARKLYGERGPEVVIG